MTVEIPSRGHVDRADHPLVNGDSAWWAIDRWSAEQGLASTALRNTTRFGNYQPHAGVLWLWHAIPCACACHADRVQYLDRLLSAGGRAQPTDLLELLAVSS